MGTGRRDSFRETQASVGPSGYEKSGGHPRGGLVQGKVRGKAGPGDRKVGIINANRGN